MTVLAQRWPLADPAGRDRLLTAYDRGGYHDQRHLAEVLDRIAELDPAPSRALLLAAWYHDAVYDSLGDLEERSARLAERDLAGLPDVAEVARLVRLTASHAPAADDRDGQLLCDADLAILAAPPERYQEYATGVRADYAHVPDAEFAVGRAAVLRGLLSRDRLFHTALGREAWEAAARANVADELERLAPAATP